MKNPYQIHQFRADEDMGDFTKKGDILPCFVICEGDASTLVYIPKLARGECGSFEVTYWNTRIGIKGGWETILKYHNTYVNVCALNPLLKTMCNKMDKIGLKMGKKIQEEKEMSE